MDLLGPCVFDLFLFCGDMLSLKTTMMIGVQLVRRIETMHEKGFLNRDIKPENLVMGLGKKSSIVYLLDLSIAKEYIIQ